MGQGTDGRTRASIQQRAATDDQILADALTQSNPTVLLTVKQVMSVLQVSRSWCDHDKTVLPWILVGRNKRLHPLDLKGFIEDQRNATMKTIMRREQVIHDDNNLQPMD